MSNITGTMTTSPVTVVCSRASPITMTIAMAPTNVDVAALGQHDVALRGTMRGSLCLVSVSQ